MNECTYIPASLGTRQEVFSEIHLKMELLGYKVITFSTSHVISESPSEWMYHFTRPPAVSESLPCSRISTKACNEQIVCCAHPEFVSFGICSRFVYVLCHYTPCRYFPKSVLLSFETHFCIFYPHNCKCLVSSFFFAYQILLLGLFSSVWSMCFWTSQKEEKSLFSLVWKYIDFFLVVEKCSCWVYSLRLTVTFSPYIKATPALSFGFYFVAEKLAISVLICLRKVPYLWLLLRSSFNPWCSIVLLWCIQM